MADNFRELLVSERFEIRVVTQYSSELFSFKGSGINSRKDFWEKLLPTSFRFNSVGHFEFQSLKVGNCFALSVQSSSVVWCFIVSDSDSQELASQKLFLLFLFLKFLRSQPHDLHEILLKDEQTNNEQFDQFSLKEVISSKKTNYKEFFKNYTDFLTKRLVKNYDKFVQELQDFKGVVFDSKGNFFFGEVSFDPCLKPLFLSSATKLLSETQKVTFYVGVLQ